MTRQLIEKRHAPRSGVVKSVVVLLHGYGADGEDLLGLAEPLGSYLPDTLFVAPDAPERCAGNPFGRQWFPIPRLDGSTQEQMEQGLAQAAEDLDAYLEALLQETGLTPDKMALLGFSQGTMMSLYVAPRRAAAVAGVVAFSGRLMAPERLKAEAKSKPPVLLIHGDADPMVPFAEMAAAGDRLVEAGFTVYGHVMQGTGHGIAPDGLQVALSFLRDRLG